MNPWAVSRVTRLSLNVISIGVTAMKMTMIKSKCWGFKGEFNFSVKSAVDEFNFS
eukprot:Pgem_evm1s8358